MKITFNYTCTFLCILFCISSCTLEAPSTAFAQANTHLLKVNLDGLTEKEVYLSNYFKEVSYVPLEQNPAALIRHISQLEIHQDKIYVLDVMQNNGILVFDLSGKYIQKIGKKGRGLGEFTRIGSFSIDSASGNIYVLDSSVQKVIIYKPSGEFIKEVKLPAQDTRSSYICVTDNEHIYTNLNLGKNLKPVPHTVRAINHKGEVLQYWLSPDSHNKGWDEPYNIAGSNGGFYKVQDGIAITGQFMDTIFMLKNNELLPHLALESKDFMTSEEIKDILAIAIKRPNKFFEAFAKSQKIREIQKYIENEHFISFLYKQSNRFHRVIYDKKSSTFFSIKELFNDLTFNKETFSTFLNTIYSNNNLIVDVTNKNLIDMSLSQSKIPPSAIAKFNNNHTFTDNPVLVFYHLK